MMAAPLWLTYQESPGLTWRALRQMPFCCLLRLRTRLLRPGCNLLHTIPCEAVYKS